jgi:hypothetical protein
MRLARKNGGNRAASAQFLLILFVIAIDANRNAALRGLRNAIAMRRSVNVYIATSIECSARPMSERSTSSRFVDGEK